MAKKRVLASWTWRDYILQLSVVIIGIMVTFIGSDLISDWSRSRQARAAMQLVVNELEVNKAQIERVGNRLIHERHGMRMFMSYGFNANAIPEDSLLYYSNPHIIGSSVDLTIRSDALEMLKSSGETTSAMDKQLLIDVLGCYNRMNGFCTLFETYSGQKNTALNHLFENLDECELDDFAIGAGDTRASWKTILGDKMCRTFLGFSSYYFGDDRMLRDRAADVDKTIDAIKTKYGLE